jgi:hypothetical protein
MEKWWRCPMEGGKCTDVRIQIIAKGRGSPMRITVRRRDNMTIHGRDALGNVAGKYRVGDGVPSRGAARNQRVTSTSMESVCKSVCNW